MIWLLYVVFCARYVYNVIVYLGAGDERTKSESILGMQFWSLWKGWKGMAML